MNHYSDIDKLPLIFISMELIRKKQNKNSCVHKVLRLKLYLSKQMNNE